ncbi:SDR family NAD(P)-dependent oxidoreductase [Pontiella sp.]|uniref:SDR family NAD(P)-dependent oxidoreductase n=1 Tax=Pontiella sp. TaxID=2837462 RepID=UPI0035667397
MKKTILITGATDGIGLATARMLTAAGHRVLVHGRNPAKVAAVADELQAKGYVAELSIMDEVEALAESVRNEHGALDVLINNAGVLRVAEPVLDCGLDVRFVVNTIAPYVLTQKLLPLLGRSGRVINLSSAAQAPVNLEAFGGRGVLDEMQAYAQSKLALTIWSAELAAKLGNEGPAILAVNPGSLLGSKMVKDAFGVDGGDLQIGADLLCRAAVSDEFADASGKYYDNDSKRFAAPHADARDPQKCAAFMQALERVIGK